VRMPNNPDADAITITRTGWSCRKPIKVKMAACLNLKRLGRQLGI